MVRKKSSFKQVHHLANGTEIGEKGHVGANDQTNN